MAYSRSLCSRQCFLCCKMSCWEVHSHGRATRRRLRSTSTSIIGVPRSLTLRRGSTPVTATMNDTEGTKPQQRATRGQEKVRTFCDENISASFNLRLTKFVNRPRPFAVPRAVKLWIRWQFATLDMSCPKSGRRGETNSAKEGV